MTTWDLGSTNSKSRKPKPCAACYLMIEKGDMQNAHKAVDGGEFYTTYTHAECSRELTYGGWLDRENEYTEGCLADDHETASEWWQRWYQQKRKAQTLKED